MPTLPASFVLLHQLHFPADVGGARPRHSRCACAAEQGVVPDSKPVCSNTACSSRDNNPVSMKASSSTTVVVVTVVEDELDDPLRGVKRAERRDIAVPVVSNPGQMASPSESANSFDRIYTRISVRTRIIGILMIEITTDTATGTAQNLTRCNRVI